MQAQLLKVTKPYNFELIPKLFLRSKQRQMPYMYLEKTWSSLISIDEKEFPVLVVPLKQNNAVFLKIIIYGNASTKEQKHLVETIQNSFNTNLQLNAFYNQIKHDKKLQLVVSNLCGLKPYFALHPYHSLIRTIIRQLISAQTALNIMSNLVTNLGNFHEQDGTVFYGMPSPKRLSEATKNELLNCKVGYKWKLIKQIATDILNEDLDLHELAKKSDEYIIDRLKEYSGIGDWTARTFLYDGFRRRESYSPYDISVVKAISLLYHKGNPIGKNQVDTFFKKYSDQKGIVIPYLFGYLWLRHMNASKIEN